MLPLIILVLVVVIALTVARSRRSGKNGGLNPVGQGAKKDSMATARRTIAYIAAFAGLLATLYATSGLVALAVITLTLRSSTLLGAGDVRTRTSFYLAVLIAGLPLWLGGWLAAERSAARASEERDARERRLFLAAIFAVTSVVALFAVHDVLATLFTWPGPADMRPSLLAGIAAGARLLVYGSTWLAYARIGWRERSPHDVDDAHDLAVYVLSGFALSFLVIGLNEALRQLIGNLVASPGSDLLSAPAGSTWTVWGAIAAWIVAGGITWAAIWQYDLARGGLHRLRVLYLYIAFLIAAPASLAGGADTLYELLRRLFGYQATTEGWSFLRDALPPLVLGSIFWAYHWCVMRRQPALSPSRAAEAAGGIAWPRRPAILLLALGGLGMVTPALISIVWLGLDFALHSGTALSGPDWWRDRLSVSIAAGFVGSGVWLGAWNILQRATTANPAQERATSERRLFLGGATLVAGLTTLGFVVAALWLALRVILGDTLDAATVSTALKDLSAAVVLALLALYHGLILRQDLRFGPVRRAHVRLVALLTLGAEEALEALRRGSGRRIEVVGYLAPDSAASRTDLATLGALLADLESPHNAPYDNALLVVYPDGGHLHRYARHAVQHSPTGGDAVPAQLTVEGAAGQVVGPSGS